MIGTSVMKDFREREKSELIYIVTERSNKRLYITYRIFFMSDILQIVNISRNLR